MDRDFQTLPQAPYSKLSLTYHSFFFPVKHTTASLFKMPPCKFFFALTRAFAASTPAECSQVKAFLSSPLLQSSTPCRSWRKHGRSICMVLESCVGSKASHGWRTMVNWAAPPPHHQSSVCICPCLLWPSSLASSSGWLREAWTETGKSEIGNGELLQEPTPYLPVSVSPLSVFPSFPPFLLIFSLLP